MLAILLTSKNFDGTGERIMAATIDIDVALKNRIEQLAELRRRPTQSIIGEAIQQYVDREEARENFKNDAMASWAAYPETGRHLTGEKVRAWLNTWGVTAIRLPPRATSNRYRGGGTRFGALPAVSR